MVAIRTRVVFDATEPHVVAAFWAEALHYEHEDIDAFVTNLVNAGHVQIEYTIDIGGKRRWRAVASLRHPDDPVDERGSGMGRRILFQAVPEAKTVRTASISTYWWDQRTTTPRWNVSWPWAPPSSASMTEKRAGGRCWSTRKATSSTSREAACRRPDLPVSTPQAGRSVYTADRPIRRAGPAATSSPTSAESRTIFSRGPVSGRATATTRLTAMKVIRSRTSCSSITKIVPLPEGAPGCSHADSGLRGSRLRRAPPSRAPSVPRACRTS